MSYLKVLEIPIEKLLYKVVSQLICGKNAATRNYTRTSRIAVMCRPSALRHTPQQLRNMLTKGCYRSCAYFMLSTASCLTSGSAPEVTGS